MAFLFKDRKVRYPFSKFRVYFNVVVAVLSVIFSLAILFSVPNLLLLAGYFAFTVLTALLMYEAKVYILLRMQRTESASYDALQQEETEEKSLLEKWATLIVLVLVVVFLGLPIILTQLMDPAWWFIGFSGFVTGTSLSEFILYLSAAKTQETQEPAIPF